MIELTVKTLDSQNHSYTVPDDISVRRFKEKIATSVGVTADKQRLIYCGRVLQDDKNLSEYDVSGKVIHLVQRPPPSTRSATGTAPNSSTSNSNARPSGATRDGNSFLLGAFTIPSDVIDPNQVQQIVQQVVSGMGDLGRNATVMSRTSDDGSSVDVHINLGQVPIQSEAQQIINQVQTMIRQAHQVLEQLSSPNQDVLSAESEAAAAGGPSSSEGATAGDGNAASEACAADSSTSEVPDSTRMEMDTAEEAVGASGDVHTTEVTSGDERPHTAAAAAGIAQATRAAAAAAVAAAAGVAGAAAAAVARATGRFPHTAASRVSPQSSEAASSDGGQTSTADQSERPAPPNDASQAPLPPPTRVLAEVITEIQQLQTALQPHLDRYCEILNSEVEFSNEEERNAAQRTFNRVSEVLHYLSHAYHAVSELMVHMNRPVPRRLYANPVSLQHPTAILQAGIPIQAQINLSATNAPSASSGATSTSPDSGAAATSNDGSPTPQGNENSSQSSSPPTTSSSQQPEGVNLNIPPMAGLFAASQSPILLMEVGPGSITIDSISATVVADAAGNQQGSGARGPTVHSMAFPQPPPPEFFQNLMHAVGHTTAQRNANNSQSQARGNTSTNTTTSTQTRSTARPVQPIPINIPGFGLASFDPYLPCHSRHIYARHFCTAALQNAAAAAAANTSNQGQAQSQSPVQGQSDQPAQGANSNGQPDVQLSGVITNLMSALLGQPNLYPQGNGASPATAGPSRASFASSPRRSAPANWRRSQVRRFATSRSSAPSANSRAFIDAIIRQQITGNRPQEATSGESDSAGPENAFSQLFETVGLVNQGNVNNNLLFANFLNDFQVEDEQESTTTLEGLISDLFMCITQGMTLQELISTCLGQTEPLDRIRPCLRQYVNQRILRNREPTPENINVALDEIAALYRSHLQEAATDANIKPDIDYVATMDKYIRHRLRDLIKLVLDDTCESFGATLYILCQFIMSEVIVLNLACFEDGQQSLERVARGRIRALSSNTNQRVEYVLISLFAVNIRHMMSNPTVTEADVQQFIVRTSSGASDNATQRETMGATAAPSSTTNPFLASTAAATAETFSASEPMDVEAPAPRNDLSHHDFKRNTAGGVASAAVRAPTLRNESVVNGIDDNMVLGQSTWREAIPMEWVPIISKDVQRQRRTTPQPPFSDAYLEGMPSKRRKMMSSNKLQVNVDSRSSLSDAVRHSVNAAGVQPLTSLDEVAYDVSENPSVQAAYNEQVRDSIRRRLQSDPDYNPRKFPSTEKYFFPDKEK